MLAKPSSDPAPAGLMRDHEAGIGDVTARSVLVAAEFGSAENRAVRIFRNDRPARSGGDPERAIGLVLQA